MENNTVKYYLPKIKKKKHTFNSKWKLNFKIKRKIALKKYDMEGKETSQIRNK